MKKQLMKSFHFLWLVMIAMGSPQLLGMCGGPTVLWHNRSDTSCPGATDPGITTDVVDQNIDIIGVNALVEGIHVMAQTCDILITVTNGDAVITGSGDRCDGVPTNPARLYLFAAAGRSILFDLEDDLTFRGAANGAIPLDLLVTISGSGTVTFALADNSTVSFNANDIGAGTQVYIGMGAANQPTLRFSRQDVNSTENVVIEVGPNSFVSYIAANDVPGVGTITFDPTNQGSGLMVLNLLSGGSGFNIGGHLVNVPLTSDILLTDIDLSTPTPMASAIFNVINQQIGEGSNGILRIINENDVYPCSSLNIDPFCQGVITGTPSGFILGPVGSLVVANLTYIDYIGTTTNTCCVFNSTDDCGLTTTPQRLRNPSAFIVDAIDNTTSVTIQFLGSSAIYFRSGVDKCGDVNFEEDFIINPALKTPCVGNIVFDVEGPLDVIGTPGFNSGLNILSLQVDPTGCPIVVGGTELPLFPSRTFNRGSDGDYLRYNNAGFLFNNRMNLFDTALIHTDENHNVYERDTLLQGLNSEPTYIGGDSDVLCPGEGFPHPTVAFYNSRFLVNTSVAATGVDWRVPNFQTGDNNSSFVFYSNGFCIDKGYGRNMILGTTPCFDGCCYTSTNNSSHLDIFQESAQATPFAENLFLLSDFNDDCITEGIVGNISGQNVVQTIFLNHGTNISIGTPSSVGVTPDGTTFTLTTTGQLLIDGSCFSFESAGGRALMPERSASTGQGGIFVDRLGAIRLLNNRIANFGAMVVRSRGGVVDLPENGAFFDSRIGIADWQVDLSDPLQRILVGPGETLSDYTLDWGAINKQYCCNDEEDNCFIPYGSGTVPGICACPPVTSANLTSLPEIQGTIQQLQIQRARICDVPHLNVNGGFVRELVFLEGRNSAEAPVAFLVIENNGVVGLGSAHKNVDSLEASIVLGINGVMLVPNGDATVILNEDVIINNFCPILAGTAFGEGTNTLTIRSVDTQKLVIKSTGVLDLGQFDTGDKQLQFAGRLELVAEPGARIVMGGGTLIFNEFSQWTLTPVNDLDALAQTTTTGDMDPFLVKLSGSGLIIFRDDAGMFIGQNSFFGVETLTDCSISTSIEWRLEDQASLQIGSEQASGGAFQIGDTGITTTASSVNTIDFSLIVNGIGAVFQIDRQGFFGLGAGIVNKFESIPSDWEVTCLSNINSVTINIQDGSMRHDQIITSDNAQASLLAIGTEGTYDFVFDPINSTILGGGNMVKINCTEICDVLGTCSVLPFSINPTVTGFAGIQPGGFFISGIMSGKYLLIDKVADPASAFVGGTALGLFDFLRTIDVATMPAPKANIATNTQNVSTLGFVNVSTIRRDDIFRIISGTSADPADPELSYRIGAVNINFDPTAPVSPATDPLGVGRINSVVQYQNS